MVIPPKHLAGPSPATGRPKWTGTRLCPTLTPGGRRPARRGEPPAEALRPQKRLQRKRRWATNRPLSDRLVELPSRPQEVGDGPRLLQFPGLRRNPSGDSRGQQGGPLQPVARRAAAAGVPAHHGGARQHPRAKMPMIRGCGASRMRCCRRCWGCSRWMRRTGSDGGHARAGDGDASCWSHLGIRNQHSALPTTRHQLKIGCSPLAMDGIPMVFRYQ